MTSKKYLKPSEALKRHQIKLTRIDIKQKHLNSGADLGGGGVQTSCTILRYPFLVINPKIFSKAPIYTSFEEGARAAKTRFFGQHFPKSAKNAFFGLFFQNFSSGAENLAKIVIKQCSGRARKINLDDQKKMSTKFFF